MNDPDVPGLVDAALAAGWLAIERGQPWDWYSDTNLRALPGVGELLDGTPEQRALALLELAAVASAPSPKAGHNAGSYPGLATSLVGLLLRRKVVLDAAQTEALLRHSVQAGRHWASELLRSAVKPIEQSAPNWTAAERAAIEPLLRRAAQRCSGDAVSTRLLGLVAVREAALPLHLLARKEAVGERLAAEMAASPEDPQALRDLLQLLGGLPASGKPSAKWKASVETAADELADAPELLLALLAACMDAADNRSTHGYLFYAGEVNEQFILGLLRGCGVVADARLLEPLRRLARYMLVPIGDEYPDPRSVKLANAAVVAIADSALPGSIAELLALERSVRHGSLLNQIRKSVDALAAAQGLTRDELLEQAVESHGLSGDGTKTVPLASGGAARIKVDSRTVTLLYEDEAGVLRKTFPAPVKTTDAEVLAELRQELKEIRKTVAGERARLDALLAAERTWPLDDWRRWYLEHPVTGQLARGTIWVFTGKDGRTVVGRPGEDGTLLLDSGEAAPVPHGATVGLWHPVLATPTEVGAWRDHCLRHALVQPVKQAFREVYVITPAEREARVYSNRFAAHVFRQVQARALMKGRGWKAPPLAWWDDGRDVGVATREFPSAGLSVEFFYDPITDLEPGGGDLWPLCTSDQVRFRRGGSDEPIPLEEVPVLPFSEALRDVDLFIGVTSIGADPEWADRGAAAVLPRLNAYWEDFGFGELRAAAEIRRELLAGLLPSLAIADRCALEERFLKVRGELRTYRIHIGSGNIQMEPNAEYLCIVTARSGKAGKLFLPLDDDPVLTLILSKAFLLAADGQITDQTILDQIRR